MRSLVHTSSRLILCRPKTGTFPCILFFRARLLSTSSSWIDESFALPIGNNGSVSLRWTTSPPPPTPQKPNPQTFTICDTKYVIVSRDLWPQIFPRRAVHALKVPMSSCTSRQVPCFRDTRIPSRKRLNPKIQVYKIYNVPSIAPNLAGYCHSKAWPL